MPRPLISIIVPCYNTGEFIEKCVKSLLEQTYENIEVIAVEHNSQDNTLETLLKMAEGDNRLRVVKSYTMTSTGATRNLGLAISKGDYLCFCDSDDCFEPDMVESLLNELIRTGADIVYCDVFVEEYDKPGVFYPRKIHPGYESLTPKQIRYELMYSNAVMNKIMTRELVFGNGILFNDVTAGEDLYFTQLIYAKAKKITYLQRPLYHYLAYRPSSTVTDPGADFDRQVIRTLESVMSFHRRNNSSNAEEIEAALYVYAMEHYIRFFHLRKTALGESSDYMEFVYKSFPNIESNSYFKSDIRPAFFLKKARMYDEMARDASVFKGAPVIVFSASRGGVTMLGHLKGLSINPAYLSDNDIKKHGAFIDGTEIIEPERIAEVEGALVVIASDIKYYGEIKKQLKGLGIPEDHIYP